MREFEEHSEQSADRQEEYRYMQGSQTDGTKMRLTVCLALVLINSILFLYCDLFASENALNKLYG